jgi:transketolase
MNEVEQLANRIRIHAMRMIRNAKSSHLGSNFSMAEIMAVLYSRILNVSPETADDPNRDRLILSKGHAAAGYYAVLSECGFFPMEWLDSFYTDGAKLGGHATRGIPGIEVSSGALGHGLPMAAGMALAGKRDEASWRVFAVLSDGECDEGSTWEAAMLAAHHGLDNLVAVIDYNKIQALGQTKDIMDLEPFADKWIAFGWAVREVDGHDCCALESILSAIPVKSEKPTCVIAHTVKGKGVSFMEDTLLWHYRNPQGEEYENALRELESKQ